MKQIEVTDADTKQAIILSRMLQEARIDLKGDAIVLSAQAIQWLHSFIEKLKLAKESEAPTETNKAKKSKAVE